MKSNQLIFKFLMFSILFTFYSCKKNIDLQCETLDDLSGTWKTNANTISFHKNYEFVDSVFYDQYNETLAYVVKGNFKLTKGFIELRDLKYVYLKDTSVIKNLMFLFPNYRFEIIDNKLYLDELGIFRPEGHSGNEISGKWKSDRIIVVYDSEQSPSFLTGIQKIEFEFNNESNTYMINYQNYYGSYNENISDGPFYYQFEYPFVYGNETKDVLGILKDNLFLTFSYGERIYTKTK